MPTFTPEQYATKLKKEARQVPFALSKAINGTAKQFQRFQTAHLRREYTERNKLFLSRAVKIKPFATKSRLRAVVQIDPPGGARTADILGKFEEGGIKRPRGGGNLAIPVEARRTKSGKISKTLRPKALDFRKVGRNLVGLKNTFIIPGVGIYQRFGRGLKSIRLLFAFAKRARIPAGLDFGKNLVRIVARRFNRHFDKAMELALRTAR